MGRRAILAIVAAVSVLSAGIGWVAGQRIKSPAEIAADQQPPDPSLITVPVERRVLSQNVVVRGTVRSSDAVELAVSSTEGSTIITRLVKASGDEVVEGDVIVEVAGRPVIVLQGELPVFRNLIPTLEGPDVKQLEEALVRLGHQPGDVDGVYDSATADAVADLYLDLGYRSVEGDDGLQSSAKAARDAVSAQQDALTQVRQALTDAQGGLRTSERLQLEQALTGAKSELALATSAATTAKDAAADALTAAEADELAAVGTADTAAGRLAQAKAGTHPDTGLPPTAAQLATLEAESSDAQAALASAETATETARQTKTRTDTEQDGMVAAARSNVELQQALSDEALAGNDTSALRRQVSDASSALADAQAELADAQAQVGAQIPASELVFLASLPREVQNLSVEVGDIPTGPVMTLSGSGTVIESGLSAADRRLVDTGVTATLEDDGLGISVEARITFVADNPGGLNLSADRYAMQLEPIDDLPEDALNLNLRISIPISSSGGEVLAVPFAALSAGSDGTARVEVERTSGQTELVRVATGLRAEGFVEIEPVEGSLDEGDRVVVGRDLQLPGTDTADTNSDDERDADEDEPDDGTT